VPKSCFLAAALMPSACKKFLQNNPSNRSMNGVAHFIAQAFWAQCNPLMENHHDPTNPKRFYGVGVCRIHHDLYPLPSGRP
jgi:hypothetical protein